MKTESEELAYYKALAVKYGIALQNILGGSKVTGRWLDSSGDCPPGDDIHDPDAVHPGYTWEGYDVEEERAWIETVAGIAERALEETE